MARQKGKRREWLKWHTKKNLVNTCKANSAWRKCNQGLALCAAIVDSRCRRGVCTLCLCGNAWFRQQHGANGSGGNWHQDENFDVSVEYHQRRSCHKGSKQFDHARARGTPGQASHWHGAVVVGAVVVVVIADVVGCRSELAQFAFCSWWSGVASCVSEAALDADWVKAFHRLWQQAFEHGAAEYTTLLIHHIRSFTMWVDIFIGALGGT